MQVSVLLVRGLKAVAAAGGNLNNGGIHKSKRRIVTIPERHSDLF